MSPVAKPRTPWEARRYLDQHGPDQAYSNRAQWIWDRFTQWQENPGRRDMDWSETAWLAYQRGQRQEVAA